MSQWSYKLRFRSANLRGSFITTGEAIDTGRCSFRASDEANSFKASKALAVLRITLRTSFSMIVFNMPTEVFGGECGKHRTCDEVTSSSQYEALVGILRLSFLTPIQRDAQP